MKKLRSSLLLVLAAVIWGTAFVGQSDAMEHIEPYTFNFLRFMLGSLVLLPFVPEFRGKRTEKAKEGKMSKTKLVLLCTLLGVVLCAASTLQQFGIALGDSVGKAGFITSLYIVLVPLLGLPFGKSVSLPAVIAVVLASVGMYFLCVKEGFALEFADILYVACALLFAVQILLVSAVAPYLSGPAVCAIEFGIAAVLSAVCMLIFETPSLDGILAAYQSVIYVGVFSCGIAYTLQVIGQKELDPTTASLIMCLESVASVIAGMIMLDQMLSTREIIGSSIMLAATILAQIPEKRRKAELK